MLKEVPTEAEQRLASEAVHAQSWHLDIDKNELRWESYVKAGYYVGPSFINYSPLPSYKINRLHQGVLNRFFNPSDTSARPIPVDLLVTGTVPAGSGLSSRHVHILSD